MIYIFETEILNNKSLAVSMQKIYGLNKCQISFIIKQLGFSKNFKAKDLSPDQLFKLVKLIENLNLILASDLKKHQSFALKNLIDIKATRGLRRIYGYPVRGQRTHTNGKTSKRQKRFRLIYEINL